MLLAIRECDEKKLTWVSRVMGRERELTATRPPRLESGRSPNPLKSDDNLGVLIDLCQIADTLPSLSRSPMIPTFPACQPCGSVADRTLAGGVGRSGESGLGVGAG